MLSTELNFRCNRSVYNGHMMNKILHSWSFCMKCRHQMTTRLRFSLYLNQLADTSFATFKVNSRGTQMLIMKVIQNVGLIQEVRICSQGKNSVLPGKSSKKQTQVDMGDKNIFGIIASLLRRILMAKKGVQENSYQK